MPQHHKCLAIYSELSDLWFTVNHSTCFKLPLVFLTLIFHKVATCLRCGGIFSHHFTTKLSLSLTMKEFENRLRFDKVIPPWVWWSSFFGRDLLRYLTTQLQGIPKTRHSNFGHNFGNRLHRISKFFHY